MEKIWSRAANWGTLLLVAGALVVFLSGRLTAGVPEEKRERADLLVKAIGMILAIVGALRVLGFLPGT